MNLTWLYGGSLLNGRQNDKTGNECSYNTWVNKYMTSSQAYLQQQTKCEKIEIV